MISLNGINFPERFENPAAGGKVALRAFFYNDGALVDPVDVSSVSIFKFDTYASSALFVPSSNVLSGQPLMQFAPSTPLTGTATPAPIADYNANWGNDPALATDFQYASGVFKLGTGDYVAPLRMDKALSGVWEGMQLDASANVSAAVTYIDVWTVKLLAGSQYQSFIHRWTLHADTFFSITDPLLVKTSTKLANKHIRFGEKVDLVAPVEVTIENKNITQSIINTLKSTLITSGAFKIAKVNDNTSLEGPFTVSGFSDTASNVNITSDGTLIFKWDTSQIPTSSDFGEAKGTYAVQVRYWANGQKIISPRFYVSLN
jgi:hypothetical protein